MGLVSVTDLLAGTRGRRPLPPLGDACLVVLDAQRLFTDPASPAFVPGWAACLPRVAALVDAFARRGLPVFATRHVHPAGDDGGTLGLLYHRLQSPDDPLSRPDPATREVLRDAPLLDKRRFSALSLPDLAAIAAVRRTLVIAGLQTHLCVTATALDAALPGLRPVVVLDATAARDDTLHLAALRVLAAGHAHVATTAEVAAALAAGGATR